MLDHTPIMFWHVYSQEILTMTVKMLLIWTQDWQMEFNFSELQKETNYSIHIHRKLFNKLIKLSMHILHHIYVAVGFDFNLTRCMTDYAFNR